MQGPCPGPRAPGDALLDLGLYLDGILPEGEARAVEGHLVACEPCRSRLRELRELKAKLEDRAVWRTRAASGISTISTSCLSAAEILLALEGNATPRTEQHLASCEGCTNDVMAIEESTEEHVRGACERPEPELMEVLMGVGKQPTDPNIVIDELAPAIVIPADAARNGSRRVSKRLAPRHPSKRTTAADLGRRRQPRNVTVMSGIFTFAAAAAAAVIVGLLLTQSAPVETSPAPEPQRQTAKVEPTPRVDAPKPSKTTPPPNETLAPAGEPMDAPEPESPFVAPTTPSPDAPPPEETPAPTAPAETPTVARAPEAPKTPLALDGPVADDGARIEVDLSRLAGGLAVKSAGASPTDKWAKVARKEGLLELKPGDRLRSTQGAFLSLEAGTYELSLAPKSELVVRGLSHGPKIGLTDGRVLCEVEKLPQGKQLVIATNAADFECTGTVFSVSADSQKALCAVEEGTVLCRGQQGDPKAVAAGQALMVARGAAAGETRPMPQDAHGWARNLRPEREVIYSSDFSHSDLSGFVGTTTDQGALHGRALVFEPLSKADNKFWGLQAHAPKGHIKTFKPSLDLRIQFSVWLEKPSHLLLQMLNERQVKYFKRDFGQVQGGRWVTLTVPVMDLESYYDPGKTPLRESDLLSDIEIFTADPGDSWRALLEDVVVYRKHYR